MGGLIRGRWKGGRIYGLWYDSRYAFFCCWRGKKRGGGRGLDPWGLIDWGGVMGWLGKGSLGFGVCRDGIGCGEIVGVCLWLVWGG